MLTKIVNGETVVLSPEEEAAVRAEWAANDPAIQPPDPADVIAAGLAIVSTSTPALNGTYSLDADAQRKISGIAAGIGSRNRLPGGLATFDYTDGFGTHTFTAAQFLDLATAIEDYLYALTRGALPAQPVAIP